MVVDELQNQNSTSVGVVTNYAVDEQSGEVSIFVSLFIPNKAGHTVQAPPGKKAPDRAGAGRAASCAKQATRPPT